MRLVDGLEIIIFETNILRVSPVNRNNVVLKLHILCIDIPYHIANLSTNLRKGNMLELQSYIDFKTTILSQCCKTVFLQWINDVLLKRHIYLIIANLYQL